MYGHNGTIGRYHRLQPPWYFNFYLQRARTKSSKRGSASRDTQAQIERKIADETFKRGESLIPLLYGRRGNDGFFYSALGNHRSSWLFPVPIGNKKNDGSYITVEVAAMYLISGIYNNDLEFASAPYLTDTSPVKSVKHNRFNTRGVLNEAWRSVEAWMEALQSRRN